MSADFANRVALVTGGSRGIGRAIALQLAAGGADIALSYATRPEPAAETCAAITALGRRAIALPCDVRSQSDVDALVAGARQALGPIDLLAHCGAISNTCTH
ncbi:MAG: SDR family NAD(P)-dependent oxidoreductase, partial [Planctomycetaceae bacterium]